MRINREKEKSEYSGVWVIAEVLLGRIQPVTYELTGCARNLADSLNTQVWVVVMGSGISREAREAFFYGADYVILADDTMFEGFNDEIEAQVLANLIKQHKPEIVICGATSRGRALIPRVAVMTECGLTADCTGLEIDKETGDLLQTRPAFGGNVMATIRCSNHRPQMATVRPKVMKIPLKDTSRGGKIINAPIGDIKTKGLKRIIDVFHSGGTDINLSDARIIISGGRGMRGPEGFELLGKLAERMGGAVGASRAAVDAGWVPYTYQVGQTGQTVQTEVYIACGISGQIQHLVGMQSCDLIIAINKDADAPIMKIADIAVVGDLFEIIPHLINEIPEIELSTQK